MNISELQARQGKVDVEAKVIEKSDPREFNKFGKAGRVCNAKIQDSSGTVTLTLWNDEIDQISVGDMVKVTNGYVGEWQGDLQLSAGKFGKLEVVGKADAKAEPKDAPKDEPDVEETDIDSDFEEELIED